MPWEERLRDPGLVRAAEEKAEGDLIATTLLLQGGCQEDVARCVTVVHYTRMSENESQSEGT